MRKVLPAKHRNVENDIIIMSRTTRQLFSFLHCSSSFLLTSLDSKVQCMLSSFSSSPSSYRPDGFLFSWCNSRLRHRGPCQAPGLKFRHLWIFPPLLTKRMPWPGLRLVFPLLTSASSVSPVIRVIVSDVGVAASSLSVPVYHRLGASLSRLAPPEEDSQAEEQQGELGNRMEWSRVSNSFSLCCESNLHIVVYPPHWHRQTNILDCIRGGRISWKYWTF